VKRVPAAGTEAERCGACRDADYNRRPLVWIRSTASVQLAWMLIVQIGGVTHVSEGYTTYIFRVKSVRWQGALYHSILTGCGVISCSASPSSSSSPSPSSYPSLSQSQSQPQSHSQSQSHSQPQPQSHSRPQSQSESHQTVSRCQFTAQRSRGYADQWVSGVRRPVVELTTHPLAACVWVMNEQIHTFSPPYTFKS
jgi:hypothetical protein